MTVRLVGDHLLSRWEDLSGEKIRSVFTVDKCRNKCTVLYCIVPYGTEVAGEGGGPRLG